MMLFSDIEYIVIIVALFIFFLLGLKRKNATVTGGLLAIDLNMSSAMKGVACVMILMSHWGQRRFNIDMPWGVSKLVWYLFANIALVWFMFFSGYGLSKKNLKNESSIDIVILWGKRLKKVYFPLLIVCIVSMVLYALLPDCFSLSEAKRLWIPQDIHRIHDFNMEELKPLLLHLFGWKDWYVLCIIFFYTLFYLSELLSKKIHLETTVLLFGLLFVYFIWAYFFYGQKEAHFYRYPWAFFLGHIVARWHNYEKKHVPLILLFILLLPILLESKIMILAYVIAIILLQIASLINRKYDMNGKIALFLGTISYFFYLCHVRIGYTIITYIGVDSILVWVLITTIVSYLLWKVYNILKIKVDYNKR